MDNLRIGIMGGTFNPIHNGHLIVAENAREQYQLNEICFIPSGKSYMKDSSHIPEGSTRAAMTELAISDNPYFTMSKTEIHRQGNSYTYETMEELKKEHADRDYYFIVGADTLFNMENWKYPERIFKTCTILVAVRDDKTQMMLEEKCSYLQKKYEACVKPVYIKPIGISSTMIREKIKIGESIRYLLPESVRNYIEHNNLYK